LLGISDKYQQKKPSKQKQNKDRRTGDIWMLQLENGGTVKEIGEKVRLDPRSVTDGFDVFVNGGGGAETEVPACLPAG
jgi:hypothetical protein